MSAGKKELKPLTPLQAGIAGKLSPQNYKLTSIFWNRWYYWCNWNFDYVSNWVLQDCDAAVQRKE